MGKDSKGRTHVEVQKGPISMNDQFTYRFRKEPESMMQDIHNNELRMHYREMDLHEPKK